MIFRLGEFFCGPGGIALGAKLAEFEHNGEIFGITHQWANDYDRDTCDTYAHNILGQPSKSVICKDVRKLDIESLADIDGFAFGFPCNDFSVVGEKKGMEGVYGPLYSFGVQVLRRFKPKWFLAENVGGLRTSNEGTAFMNIIEDLEASGYNVVAHLYKFEEYGVPQARHRIIIVGIDKKYDLKFQVPSPKGFRLVTSKEALTIPSIPISASNQELTKQSETVVERLKHIRPGQNVFNAVLPDHLRLNVRGAQISQIYKRLDPNKPAYTVTGSGGGGTHIYHWEENRALTNRERARLQTFPDDFEFLGSKESVRKQIGMAVPPLGAKVIFEAIFKTFAGIKYSYINPNIETSDQQLFGRLSLRKNGIMEV